MRRAWQCCRRCSIAPGELHCCTPACLPTSPSPLLPASCELGRQIAFGPRVFRSAVRDLDCISHPCLQCNTPGNPAMAAQPHHTQAAQALTAQAVVRPVPPLPAWTPPWPRPRATAPPQPAPATDKAPRQPALPRGAAAGRPSARPAPAQMGEQPVSGARRRARCALPW